MIQAIVPELIPSPQHLPALHENRAECLFSLLKSYLRVFRGFSKFNLPGYVGFFQFLRNFRQQNACEQAELILQAALDPTIARRAKRGEFVKCLDHFDLLQTGRLREARLLLPPRLRTERESFPSFGSSLSKAV